MSTFAKYNQLDDIFNRGPLSYHIEVFDNGVWWQLRLIHTVTSRTVDFISLEGRINIDMFDKVWLNKKVKQCVMDDAQLAVFRKNGITKYDEMNRITLKEFVSQHNNQEWLNS